MADEDENEGGGRARAFTAEGLRDTVVKRPEMWGASSSYEECLKADVACKGLLEKLATSLFAQWQCRYWELRGHFMVYFKDEASRGGAPLGAIDIRNIKSTTVLGSTLVLTSKSREIKLRAPGGKTAAAITSVKDWQESIEEVMIVFAAPFPLGRV